MEGLSRLIERLRRCLPECVTIELGGDAAGELLPAELAATEGWSPHRRAQFAIGRTLARRALRRFGLDPVPILFGVEGEPLWPSGFVGSISHKRQSCIVMIASSESVRGVGIDLEHDGPDAAEAELVRRVCLSEPEHADAKRLAESTASPGTLFLSAKEAFYKFQFPLTRSRLDWDDVVVSFSPPHLFTALAKAVSGTAATRGTYLVGDGWILTVVVGTQAISSA
jgi:4'-phosphopantetheinyl transferase EntD